MKYTLPEAYQVHLARGCIYTMMKNFHEDEWERQIDLNCKVSINTCFSGLGLL
jgi:hypothetical protein